MTVLEWAMEPGDAVAFDYRTLHGARGNTSDIRRRAFSLRLVGVTHATSNGRTNLAALSRPWDAAGDRLREDWFPVIWRRAG